MLYLFSLQLNIKEESSEVDQNDFWSVPGILTDVEIKREVIEANNNTEQVGKRRRVSENSPASNFNESLLCLPDLLPTRVRRPSSSASSGHGTLSDESEGGVATPVLPSSGNSPYSRDIASLDLGIGADSVDFGSLASLNCLNSSLDEMIQASSQHNRGVQVSFIVFLSVNITLVMFFVMLYRVGTKGLSFFVC